MSPETRMALLEDKLNRLEKSLNAERTRSLALEKTVDTQQKELLQAKTVGRLVLWALLGASAFLSQVQSIVAWIRKE